MTEQAIEAGSPKPINVLVAEILTGEKASPWHYSREHQCCIEGINPETGRCSWFFKSRPPGAKGSEENDPDCFRFGNPFEQHDPLYWLAPDYEHDYSALMPIAESQHFNLMYLSREMNVPRGRACWLANTTEDHPIKIGSGDTILLAICDLLIVQATAPKIREEPAS